MHTLQTFWAHSGPLWSMKMANDGQWFIDTWFFKSLMGKGWYFKYTSSTAQGGGGSFKNRKPIGEVGCCESGMAKRIHWWTERCLRSPLCLSLSLTIYLPIQCIYVSIYLSIYLSSYLSPSFSLSSNYLSTYLPIYLSTYLPMNLSIYLTIYLSIYLSLSLFHLSSCLPVYLSIYLSVCLSICLPVYLWCSVIQCIVV